MLGGIGTIVIAVLVFALMVAIHEFGHFGAAKLFKIRVNEYAIGMGPAIWKKRYGETLYSLRAIPMGGFCQLEGETEDSNDEHSFNKAAWYKRFIVVIAGPIMLMPGLSKSPAAERIDIDNDSVISGLF